MEGEDRIAEVAARETFPPEADAVNRDDGEEGQPVQGLRNGIVSSAGHGKILGRKVFDETRIARETDGELKPCRSSALPRQTSKYAD